MVSGFSIKISPREHYGFIDGLRAVAVSLVVLFHFQLLTIENGFLGVDIFFVISGFVITNMIRRSREIYKYNIEQFWRRRILRIIPALYFATLSAIIVSSVVFLPEEFLQSTKSALASILFSANLYFNTRLNYFDFDNDYSLFLHHWSLSVEEQFYIFFPIFISLLYRFWNIRFYIMGLTITASVFCYFWFYQGNQMDAFYLLPARGWEFLIGSTIAFLPRGTFLTKWQAYILAIAGLLLIGVAVVEVLPSVRWGQPELLCAVIGTALVIYSCLFGPRTLIQTILSVRIIRFVGLISFSLYLVHWPIFVFAQYIVVEPLSPIARAALLVPTATLAWLNWRIIEVPFRGARMANVLRGAKLWWVLAASTSLLLGILGLISVSGFTFRVPVPAVQEALAGRQDINDKRSVCHSDEESRPIDPEKACIFGSQSQPTVAMWGDSHGAELAQSMGDVLRHDSRSILQLTSSSCPPALAVNFRARSGCRKRNDAVLSYLERQQEISTVVLVMRYDGYPEHVQATIIAGLQFTTSALVKAGKKVIIISPFPRPPFNVPHGQARAIYLRRDIAKGISADAHRVSVAGINSALAQMDKTEDVTVFDPASAMCNRSICPFFSKGRALYFDDNHPSRYGAKKVAKKLSLLL